MTLTPNTSNPAPRPTPAADQREQSFLGMVMRNKELIWNICRSYGFSAAWEVEDAYQEVLCMLWRDMDQFKGRSAERTWVYRVAKNTLLMLKRKDSNLPQPDNGPLAPFYSDTVPDTENYNLLMELVNHLPDMDRDVVHAHIEGFSYKEISDIFGLTVPAVAMRLARSKARLRRQYNHLK